MTPIVVLRGVPGHLSDSEIGDALDVCGAVVGITRLPCGGVRVTFASAVGAQAAQLLSPLAIGGEQVNVDCPRDDESSSSALVDDSAGVVLNGAAGAEAGTPRGEILGEGVTTMEVEVDLDTTEGDANRSAAANDSSEQGGKGVLETVGAAVAVPIGAAVAAATVLESKVGANRAVENTAAAVSRAAGVGTGGVADRAASRLDAIGETMNGAVQRSLDAGAKVVSKVPGWGALARMTRMGGRK